MAEVYAGPVTRARSERAVDIGWLYPDTSEWDAGSRMDITPTILSSPLTILKHLGIAKYTSD